MTAPATRKRDTPPPARPRGPLDPAILAIVEALARADEAADYARRLQHAGAPKT